VRTTGQDTFDRNSFVRAAPDREDEAYYFSHLKDGLFMPDPDYWGRLLMSDLRHSEQVPLDAVGGTMLLVDAGLHRAGFRFPEIPYEGLIETEGFGALSRDLGVRPIGLPRVEVVHVPW
jgi:hypothetical protein